MVGKAHPMDLVVLVCSLTGKTGRMLEMRARLMELTWQAFTTSNSLEYSSLVHLLKGVVYPNAIHSYTHLLSFSNPLVKHYTKTNEIHTSEKATV